jgi:glutaredoxin 3
MAQVEIYTRPWCTYCRRVRKLLQRKGVAFTEIDLDAQPEREPEMQERCGGRDSVPQILIDGVHVGGADELLALDDGGRLNAMLNGNRSHGNA